MSDVIQVDLAEIPTRLTGEPDDPYFQSLQVAATDLLDLAALVDHHVPCEATVLDIGANIDLTAIAAGEALCERHRIRTVADQPQTFARQFGSQPVSSRAGRPRAGGEL